jgi:hypothetical protein
MLKALTISAAMMVGMAAGATAQSLTPEHLQAMIDQELSQENPYKAILADPDPERSLAAMRIMLRSGDKELVALALEFGLLSPNPQVQRIAVEAYLATQPTLTLRIDGTRAQGNKLADLVRYLDGTFDIEKMGFLRIDVGALSDDRTCYVDKASNSQCIVTVNSDGIFLTLYRWGNSQINSRMQLNDSGGLEGMAQLRGIDELVPISFRLLN